MSKRSSGPPFAVEKNNAGLPAGASAGDEEPSNPALQTSKGSLDADLGAVAYGLLLAVFSFFLLERQQHLILGHSPFLQSLRLGFFEKAGFLLAFSAEILLLILSLSVLLRRLARPLLQRHSWIAAAAVATIYVGIVSGQHRVFQYIKDGIDVGLIRNLSGGNLGSALSYIRYELAELFPLMLAATVLMAAAGWAFRHYNLAQILLRDRRFAVRLFSAKRLLIANLALILLVPVIFIISPDLHSALGFSLAHSLYSVPAKYLTDFDWDGYGMLDSPPDFAPFDRSRHPYALEIPGNGIDEDGVGGDLKEVIARPTVGPWDAAKLEPRNVMLIVVESARYDLLDQQFNGAPVMPVLRSLPGERFSMFSHSGYTIPSIVALHKGSLLRDDGIALIDRLQTLGYQTGVFSGQAENFGKMADSCDMHRADIFIDADVLPKQFRMYTSTEPGALSVPSGVVNAKFVQWYKSLDHHRPFFAYLNWQEMHFPYYYPGAPRLLFAQPIGRGDIVPENKEWLRKTYLNAARTVDNAMGEIANMLQQAGIFKDTVILVVGDHGEELFDHGNLGHGTTVNYEQYNILGKLINSRWKAPQVPLGSSDASSLIHNALLRSPQDALPFNGEVLCHTGDIHRPGQVGLVTSAGLVKYNFKTGMWSKQARSGAEFVPCAPQNRGIYIWESLLVQEAARKQSTAAAK